MLVLIPRRYADRVDIDIIEMFFPFSSIVYFDSKAELIHKLRDLAIRTSVRSVAIVDLVGLDTLNNILLTIDKMNVVSMDKALVSIISEFVDEAIAIYVTEECDLGIVDNEVKLVYRDAPIRIVRVCGLGDVLKHIQLLLQEGFHVHVVTSLDLCLGLAKLGGSVLGSVKIINLLDKMVSLIHRTEELSIPRAFYIAKILPCISEDAKVRLVIKYDSPIYWALKGIYLAIPRSSYCPAIDAVTFRGRQGEVVTVYGDGRVYIAQCDSVERAEEIAKKLMELIALIKDNMSSIEETFKEVGLFKEKVSVLDVYKLLPKLNCGRCGEKTCMAFASKLLNGEADISRCPYLDVKARKELMKLIAPIGIIWIP